MKTRDADQDAARRSRPTGVATVLAVLFVLVVVAAIAAIAADLAGVIELTPAAYAVFYLVVPVAALALIVAIAGRGSRLIAAAAIPAVPLSVAAGAFLVVSGLPSRVAPDAPPGPDTKNLDQPHKNILPDASSTKGKVIGGCNRSNSEKLRFNRDLARRTRRLGDVVSAVNAATTIVGCYSFEIKETRYLVIDAFAEERAAADPLVKLYSSPTEDLPLTLETTSDDGGYFRKGGRISWFLGAGTYIIEVGVNGVISDRIAEDEVTLTAIDASPGTTYGPVDALEIAPGDGAPFTASMVDVDGTLRWFLLPEVKKSDLAPASAPGGAATQRCIVIEIDNEEAAQEPGVRRVVDAFWMRATPDSTLLGGENWIIFPFDDYNATQDYAPGGERNYVSIAASNFQPAVEKQVFMAAVGVTEGNMEVTTRGPFKVRAFYAAADAEGRCTVAEPKTETPASEDDGEGPSGGG
jgi:hypothetical protein